jgi:hypothetical protein
MALPLGPDTEQSVRGVNLMQVRDGLIVEAPGPRQRPLAMHAWGCFEKRRCHPPGGGPQPVRRSMLAPQAPSFLSMRSKPRSR